MDQVREVLTVIDAQLQTLEAAKGAPYEALFNSKIEFLKIIDGLWGHKLGKENIPLVDLGIIPTVRTRLREHVVDENGTTRLKPILPVQDRVLIMQGMKLNEGSQGVIKTARFKDQVGEEVVVKKFKAETWSDYYDAYKEYQIGREIAQSIPSGESSRVMIPLDIRFYGDGKKRNIAIVYSKALGDMHARVNTQDSEISHQDKVGYFLDAARGLAQMHRANYAHNDFKGENALVFRGDRKNPYTVRVTDFGFSVQTTCVAELQGFKPDRTGGTLPPKEAVLARKQGTTKDVTFKKVDVFSFATELGSIMGLPEYDLRIDLSSMDSSSQTSLDSSLKAALYDQILEKATDSIEKIRAAIADKLKGPSISSEKRALFILMFRSLDDIPARRPSMDEMSNALLAYRRSLS